MVWYVLFNTNDTREQYSVYIPYKLCLDIATYEYFLMESEPITTLSDFILTNHRSRFIETTGIFGGLNVFLFFEPFLPMGVFDGKK